MIIENNSYRFELDDSFGSVVSFSNKKKEFISCNIEPLRPLFTLRFIDELGKPVVFSALDEFKTTLTREIAEENEYIKIFFNKSGEHPVSVLVTIRCPFNSAMTYWRISVENKTGWIIEWIEFPDIVVPNDLTAKGGTGKVVWPYCEGVLIEDASMREASFLKYIEPGYPSEAIAGIYPTIVPTQFMAYYEEKGGLYFGAHDDKCNVKCVECFPMGDGIKLLFRLYPEGFGNGTYEMEYDMVLAVFEGDWHDAADIYRNWHESCAGHKAVPIEENDKIPDWYGESPIVVTYPVRGKYDMDVMEPNAMFPYIKGLSALERLAEAFDSKIMALLMHWEGSAPWAPPYVWPPYGGEGALREFAAGLHEKGHLLGVYCSGIGWTEQSNLIAEYNMKEKFDREDLKEVMCLSPEGDLPFSHVCTGQRRGYDLCPSQQFTKDTITKEVEYMIEGGCDYIQAFDQNHGGNSYFCYSKTHGHPPAPGKWQIEAMRELFGKLQEVTDKAGKKVLFGCESAASEPYISDLMFSDSRHNVNFFIGTPIPLYAYLYHEYLNNFMGNQVCSNGAFDYVKSPENLLYRIAYSFHAGDMTTAVITENGDITWNWGVDPSWPLPEQEPIIRLICNTNAWRRLIGKPYLHNGKMMKPFLIEGSPIQNIKRSNGISDLVVPSLLTSCWQATDGSLGQIVVNHTKESIDFSVIIPKFTEKKVTLHKKADGTAALNIKADISGRISCKIEPLSALLVKVE